MTSGPPVLVPATLARGLRGAVVAPHHLATAAGLSILAGGGSAVDAAIATNAALAVVMPSGCGIGGDAFWLIWDADAGRQLALNGSGRAPAAADPTALRRDGHATIPLRGPLAVTVPGAVRSWGDAYARFGRLSRAAILAPALELAREGFAAWPGFISAVEATLPSCVAAMGEGSGFEQVYRPNGRPWRLGQTDVAIGCAGLAPLDDWRGRSDRQGRGLAATVVAIADEVAAAADLARSKDAGLPVCLVRGLGRFVVVDDGPGAGAIQRPDQRDLFR